MQQRGVAEEVKIGRVGVQSIRLQGVTQGDVLPTPAETLQDLHEHVLIAARRLARKAAELGDDGTDDLLVSQVVRSNELQVWFLSEHVVESPPVPAHHDGGS